MRIRPLLLAIGALSLTATPASAIPLEQPRLSASPVVHVDLGQTAVVGGMRFFRVPSGLGRERVVSARGARAELIDTAIWTGPAARGATVTGSIQVVRSRSIAGRQRPYAWLESAAGPRLHDLSPRSILLRNGSTAWMMGQAIVWHPKPGVRVSVWLSGTYGSASTLRAIANSTTW